MVDTFYTPEDLVKMLKVDRPVIMGWLKDGLLPSVKLGKHYRIPASKLEAVLQAHTVQPGATNY